MEDDTSSKVDVDFPSHAWRVSGFARLYVGHDGQGTRPVLPLLVGAVLWSLFWVWFIGSSAHTILETDALIFVLLASIWMLISPLLQAQAEHRVSDVVLTLSGSDERDGWKIEPLIDSLVRANRYYWPISIGFAMIFPIGFADAQSFMQNTLGLEPLSSPMFVLGIFVMTATGFASGNGLWSAMKVILMFASIEATSKTAWYPIRVDQIRGHEELSKFALRTAWSFSVGTLFAPIVFLAFQDGEGATIILAGIGLVVLIFGAAALFAIPIYFLRILGERARKDQLDLVADQIECLLAEDLPELCQNTEEVYPLPSLSLEELVILRNLLTSVATLGRPIVFLWQVSLLLVVPLLATIGPQLVAALLG